MTEPTEADIRAKARRICEEEGIDPPYGVMGELVLAGVRAGIALARRIAVIDDEAEAENAKLREALRDIAEMTDIEADFDGFAARTKARAALETDNG